MCDPLIRGSRAASWPPGASLAACPPAGPRLHVGSTGSGLSGPVACLEGAPYLGGMKAARKGLPVYVPPRTVWSVGAQVVLLVLLGTAMRSLGPVLTLLAAALLLGLAAEPVVRRLQSWGLRRGLGVALIALTLLGVIGLLILTLVPMLVEQLQHLVEAAPGFFDELTHITIEEGEQQRSDMRTVHIGIRHDNDFAVAQLA